MTVGRHLVERKVALTHKAMLVTFAIPATSLPAEHSLEFASLLPCPPGDAGRNPSSSLQD